jgi:FMN phosphatase YigB (HAD superfamily)
MKYLIFDFDGVLGDTWEATVNVKAEMEGLAYQESLEHTLAYFDKPSHTRSHNLTQEQIDRKTSWVRDFASRMIERDFPLFDDFINEIKAAGFEKAAVVSSGGLAYVEPKVKLMNMDFTHTLTFEDHHSKEEKVEWVCADWGVDLSQVYYFTDTTTDVIELREILDNSKIIGCSWGFQGYDKLREVLPENQILKEFADIHTVI